MSDRDELAEWWQSFDGPAYPSGEQVADAFLASGWLRRDRARERAEALEEFATSWDGIADEFSVEVIRAIQRGARRDAARIRSDAGIGGGS